MKLSSKRVLVTGANGFIGKNLVVRLNEMSNVSVSTFLRGDDPANLPQLVALADAVVHLAGENRPNDDNAFTRVNTDLTISLCKVIEQEFKDTGRNFPLILASSTQAERDTPYGRSKLYAEIAVQALAKETGNPCVIFRLPSVFGKWCKPNYNSVVATFCYNISRGIPIQINDPTSILTLVYVDDVILSFLSALNNPKSGFVKATVEPEYTVNLSALSQHIRNFGNGRYSLMIDRVGVGFLRALYVTYLSYLPTDKFSYQLRRHADPRGVFVEMLKTSDSGQFSYFTVHPGFTRGDHYHHSKTEKFLVIKGESLFRFRHLLTNELVEFRTSGNSSQVIDTIPGWTHNITNIGREEMVVLLWANENFDPQRPDTVVSKV